MMVAKAHEQPPLEVSASFTGGLQGIVNAEATLGPAPPPPPLYDRVWSRLVQLRWLVEPLVTGISDALTVRRPSRERDGA